MSNYIIPGRPVPLQRPRFSAINKNVYDPQKNVKRATSFVLKMQHRNKPLFTGPLRITIFFYFALPKNKKYHEGTPFVGRPDLDNLIKFTLDCSINILFPDDALICEIIAKKLYSSSQCTKLIIENL